MPKYVFAYHGGGMPESEEEQAKHMAAWGEWMGGIGAAFVDHGAPTSIARTVTPSAVEGVPSALAVALLVTDPASRSACVTV